MSPNVGNFVHDLVEMAKAMETLPQVQRELGEAQAKSDSLNTQIESLRADLEQSRSYAASLEQRNRDLEVARDDAELRFLELDEKADKVVAKLASITALAHDASVVIEPPKPQPEPVVEHAADPMIATHGEGSSEQTSATSSVKEGVTSGEAPQPPSSQGQGEGNPTTNTDQIADAGMTSPVKPFSGRLYINTPNYVSREDWRNGGGTDETYDWRYGDTEA